MPSRLPMPPAAVLGTRREACRRLGRVLAATCGPALIPSLPLALTGCGAGTGAEATLLPLQRLDAASQGRWPVREYVLRSSAEWAAAWAEFVPYAVLPPERPTVDFATHMVLGISRGEGPNGCHGLSILRVFADDAGLHVEFRHQRGADSAGVACTQAVVPLNSFVSVPRSDRPVRFLEVSG